MPGAAIVASATPDAGTSTDAGPSGSKDEEEVVWIQGPAFTGGNTRDLGMEVVVCGRMIAGSCNRVGRSVDGEAAERRFILDGAIGNALFAPIGVLGEDVVEEGATDVLEIADDEPFVSRVGSVRLKVMMGWQPEDGEGGRIV